MQISPKLPIPSGLSANKQSASSIRLWGLIGWIFAIFLLGGGARPDIPQLLVLRPLSVIVTALGCVTISGAQLRAYRGPLVFALCSLFFLAAQLIPLPPAWWSHLPGRQIIVEIDRAAQLGAIWRPMSMAPSWTLNALWALFIPISVLINAIQLSRRGLLMLCGLMVVIGQFSALLAIAQLQGDPIGPLYFYEVTNNGAAVGLFANRNHHAVFLAAQIPLAFALLKVWFSSKFQTTDRIAIASFEGIAITSWITFIFLMILVVGSRAGLIAMVLAVLATLAVLKPFSLDGQTQLSRSRWGKRIALASLLAGFALVSMLALSQGRALAWDRLVASDPTGDRRAETMPTVVELAWTYFPVGSGIGTYEPVFKVHEPDHLLEPSYSNHAHNDWLELLATGGLAGLLLLGWGTVAYLREVWRIWQSSSPRGPRSVIRDAGMIVVGLFALASIGDYPLRVPSLSAMLVLMVVLIYSPFEPAKDAR